MSMCNRLNDQCISWSICITSAESLNQACIHSESVCWLKCGECRAHMRHQKHYFFLVVEFFSLFRNLTKWRIVKLHDLFHNSMKQVLLHLSSACIDFGWESERASVYCFVNRCSAIAWYSLTIIQHHGSHLFYNSHTACLDAKTNLSKGKQSKAMQR